MNYDISGLRILVVDDSYNMRQIIRRILRVFNLRNVYEASDGTEALARMAAVAPDIVLTNWEMAPMDGLRFVRAVRSRESGAAVFVPIIMISGYTDLSRVVEARAAGITEFIAKPLSAKGLYARIVRVIDKPRRYVDSRHYFGPDRRLKDQPFPGPDRRRPSRVPPPSQGEAAAIDWVEQ